MGGRRRLDRPGVGYPGEVCRWISLVNLEIVNTEVRDEQSLLCKAVNTMLPRKASKLQLYVDRTLNGHTWAG